MADSPAKAFWKARTDAIDKEVEKATKPKKKKKKKRKEGDPWPWSKEAQKGNY